MESDAKNTASFGQLLMVILKYGQYFVVAKSDERAKIYVGFWMFFPGMVAQRPRFSVRQI